MDLITISYLTSSYNLSKLLYTFYQDCSLGFCDEMAEDKVQA